MDNDEYEERTKRLKEMMEYLEDFKTKGQENFNLMVSLVKSAEQQATIYCVLFWSLILIESIRYALKGF